ncbi:ABC transporter permease subunit [Litorivicinus lipolyticus]|uniref:ABC transporter permease subunit n=1 Tax=Litorivicinus lipolyticus TaxID=418701 RepID=A0A5Q2QFI3_9GAMM|nr:carbohydrate ABC transporter permease [Litorivicinus lipolyticus]QGG81131.1 ABC transporter permease subunit [Litorivicinus lipolyticus]
MFPEPIQKRSIFAQISYKITLPLALAVWLLPLFAVLLTAVRPGGDINAGNYWGMPSEILWWQNFAEVIFNSEVGPYMINSLKITIPTMLGAVGIACLTGYALAVYRFRLNLVVFFMFIAGNFVPFQILMVPVRELTLQLGLYNSMWGLVMFHVAFQAGFCTLFMRNFIKALPFDLIEAARIDGASEFAIFTRIVLPLMRPAIAALCVLIFTFIWNDFFWATVLIQSESDMPVTGGLKALNGQWVARWHLVSAGSIIAALPPVLMFFAMQKHFIAGLTLGASKG